MMAELEIDQSNLPRVQEVRQCFAVLEDGVLAHNLQEQEIEQFYTTNIQKNQLVQNDIRVAKRLQDEEDEQRVQHRASLRHASRQIEEQDFEYARVIQEELQRGAEEARRRELDDEELAKRMQEEEEQVVRRRNRIQGVQREGNSSESSLLRTLEEERYPFLTSRWQCRASPPSYADLSGPPSLRGAAAHEHATPWSNQGRRESVLRRRESESTDSDDSDSAFARQLSVTYQRLCERIRTMPRHERASLNQRERDHRRTGSSYTEGVRGWEEEERRRRRWGRSYSEEERSGRGQEVTDRRCSQSESITSRGQEVTNRRCSRSESIGSSGDRDVTDRRCSRSESVSSRGLSRTWSYVPDKRVHFKEDKRRSNNPPNDSRVWEMLGQILRERGVPVRLGGSGAPLQIGPQSRDSQVLHGSEASYGGDPRPHHTDFQRAAVARHSFHGYTWERRRLSQRENGGRDHREERDGRRDNGELCESRDRGRSLADWERRGSTRSDYRRTSSERRLVPEERLNSEEEQEAELHQRRALRRSQSFLGGGRIRSRRGAAGTLQQPETNGTSLDLRDLRQVLEDEELARQLQEEEERVLRRSSQISPSRSYPDGDFRVAQVAQDEEIARFMQKQEIKSKRQSRELEGPSSWREHRAMMSHHDRRAARERHVPRERLDSEGLPSPTEDCPPENQPPSPLSTTLQIQQTRNIAEELDPTFQARRRSSDGLQVAPTGPSCQSHSALSDFVEEPTFIPPTKRPADKSGRSKPKDKKENCKQQ